MHAAGRSSSPLGAMESQASQVTYAPSWRRAPLVAGLYLLLSWLCYRHSFTDDEVTHRMALAGAILFFLVGGALLLRQVLGFPKLVLEADGFTLRYLSETKRFAWARYGSFTPGPLESISFIDRETGSTESVFNLTNRPSDELCKELTRWGERFTGPTNHLGIAPNNRSSGRDAL
jgi:hypothetical protein